MTKKKNIGLIIGMIILLFVAGVSLFIAFSPVYHKTIQSYKTKEFNATVNDVVIKSEKYEISVSEYPCAVTVNKREVINENSLLELRSGDIIKFSIPEFYSEMLNDSTFHSVPIVSLKVDNTDIVTLESHIEMENREFVKVRITAFVFATLFLCGAIICLVFLIKQSRVKKPLES